ncbi:hypothetical protein LTR37_003440 [Vermiconidia calcicola]|uniref:Uncharacterized protein n=1 Tax=Vermiconidia calcicola TaxID=1690605 RepID=A0ACC3NQU4_9PEZI|nr:hypothetical protein LTR37_003440 [Vermiconidia calcicola]
MSTAAPSLADDGSNWTSTIHDDTYPAILSATASNLDGKTMMITGAANGVGRATAIAAARAGASQIVAVDMSSFGKLEEDAIDAAVANGKAKPKVLLLNLDITDRARVQDVANYWRAFEVNLGGTFNVVRYFLPLLLNTKHGLKTIINVASIGALRVGKGASSYRTTKFALLRWTDALNTDYGEQGLLAYCIHPGALLTDLGGGMPKDAHALLTDKVELPADTMVWLAQERREWLAGRYVSCNWDMPEFVGRKEEIVSGDKLKMRMAF